ncbi:MAG: sugar ABC transporter ATP-binding protein [Rhizobiales bacterium]|nr:sugar ABC transporter ATP-binding protein [Hyphomicrobiales bacterium]
MAPEARDGFLVASRVEKLFGGTRALAGADLTVRKGEIHALLGANGAGKSTLIKILAGIHEADGGDIRIGGEALVTARRRISFVHQDLGLIEPMSVRENMAMGYGYPRRWRLIDWRAVNARAEKALDFLDTPLPMDRPVAELSRAEKSIVAIARALADSADLLVLDEPTASLPEADVARLFRILHRLRERGVGIIYVSHRLDEIFRIADAVTVFRDGRTVAAYRDMSALSPEQLVADIVGKVPPALGASAKAGGGTAALVVRGLSAGNAGPVSFRVDAGEIVGLAGLRGAGHEAVGRALAGVLPIGAGTIEVGGAPLKLRSPADAIASGIGFATGKRAEEALAGTMTVKENLFLNPLNFGGRSFRLRSRAGERREAAMILQRFDVRPPDPDRDIGTLSGGNQQKVVLARWAGQGYRLLVLEDPTIGVDFGAKSEIYRMMQEDARRGTATIVVSSDLDELAQIADRVLAFSSGRIVAEIGRGELSVEALTTAVGGIVPAAGKERRGGE